MVAHFNFLSRSRAQPTGQATGGAPSATASDLTREAEEVPESPFRLNINIISHQDRRYHPLQNRRPAR